jgi:hypothetical protein
MSDTGGLDKIDNYLNFLSKPPYEYLVQSLMEELKMKREEIDLITSFLERFSFIKYDRLEQKVSVDPLIGALYAEMSQGIDF